MAVTYLDFKPRRFLSCRHRQTILAALFGGTKSLPETVQHKIELPDGDSLFVYDDSPASAAPDLPTLLVHGLGGSHASSYLTRLAKRLRQNNQRVFRMDMRGCGLGIPVAKRTAHAGASDDLAQTIRWIQEFTHSSSIRVVAYSLSGNILLKLLSESEETPNISIEQAIAICPPIDLAYASHQIKKKYWGFYDYQFIRSLKKDIAQRLKHHPDCKWSQLTPFPKSLFEFDDRFTAPLNGFQDANDYYQRSSSKANLHRISVPTKIMIADDDPVVPAEIFDNVQLSETTNLFRTPHGGHMGYLASKGRRWLDDQIISWLESD